MLLQQGNTFRGFGGGRQKLHRGWQGFKVTRGVQIAITVHGSGKVGQEFGMQNVLETTQHICLVLQHVFPGHAIIYSDLIDE